MEEQGISTPCVAGSSPVVSANKKEKIISGAEVEAL